MKLYLACLFQCLTTTLLLSQSNPDPRINNSAMVVPPISAAKADPKAQARILDHYGKLPLSFEANHGQTDGRVKFLSRTGGYSLFLTGDEAVLALSASKSNTHKAKIAGAPQTLHSDMAQLKTGGVLRMKLRNANLASKVTGVDELAGRGNYFIGNDPTKWRTNVPTYAKVKYERIYAGIDLVYYGNQRQLEYDFILAPGADPRRIAFDIRGAERIRRDAHGDLVLKMGEDEIRWHKPVVYQEKDGTRQEIAAHYAITDKTRVGFEIAGYDASRPLYIDPLIYSTYLGGSGNDQGNGIAVDSAGSAYVIGTTYSTDFPTLNPLQTANAGAYNAFVSKLNSSGSALVYSTYLGGNGNANGLGIAVDSTGSAYVTGLAGPGFPTVNPFQTNGNAFLTKISPAGSALVYSTYLNFASANGIALDNVGNAYVTGVGVVGGVGDAFAAKINASGSGLIYSFYVGGSGINVGSGIAVDGTQNAYITGYTTSTDFPTVNALQPTYGGGEFDAFVAKINPSGSALVYSTYLGGNSSDDGSGIAVDGAGNAYVVGSTGSFDFPTMNPFQSTCGFDGDAFVTKINSTGSALVYSTCLGGHNTDFGQGIAVDRSGNAYVVGSTNAKDFPTASPAQPLKKLYFDAFVTKFNTNGSALFCSTFLGGNGFDYGYGIAVDASGNAYVTGVTPSTNFPTKNPLQPANRGGGDAFVAKIQMVAKTTTTLSSSPNPSNYAQAVTFTAVVTSSPGLGAPPDGETVTFMKGTRAMGTGVFSGGSANFTTSALSPGPHAITAIYGGDSNFAGSKSNTVKQVVN